MTVMVPYRPWNVFERLFLYGLAGFAAESLLRPQIISFYFFQVCFTATWEAVEHGNRKLIGVTSMYIFFVYGMSILVLEKLYLNFKEIIPLPLRAALYVLVCYCWEFSSGLFLKRYFHYHFMGLITFEYIPVWYISSIICERFLIRYALQSAWLVTEEKKID
ncbi:hypothetical protein OESDEN_15530 [Oesophagostomum dentatum]|uniref:Uncharacterized protein n=1 Tax=Oesophagostomum dentatum TaxID=61180 RepID=A0A0B1SHF4_OESDE|nr:hypothetical protein OESDEN_15530 [Oesophagostomum dentatum]